MTTPLDQEENVKRIVCESSTYTEIIEKLGFSKNANYHWVVEFVKRHKLKMKPLEEAMSSQNATKDNLATASVV